MSVEIIKALDEAINAIADLDVDTLADRALDEFVIGLQRCPPERPTTALDEVRARLRWQHLHQAGDGDDDPDPADEPAA